MAGGLEGFPAVHHEETYQEHGEHAAGVVIGEQHEGATAEESEAGGDEEGFGEAELEPEEGLEHLAAVHGVDGEDIEEEEAEVDELQGESEGDGVFGGVLGEAVVGGEPEQGDEGDVDEGAGGDAPEVGAGSVGGVDEGDAAEGPEEDIFGVAADLAGGEGVAEFVEEDDGEEGEVFGHGPDDGVVVAAVALDLPEGDEEPGPVDGDLDAFEAEEGEGPLLGVGEGHGAS